MRTIFLITIFAFVLASCGQTKQPGETVDSATTAAIDSAGKEPLYPYPQYIQEQIAYVDSMPLAIEMKVFENGKMVDSTYINRDRFKELARQFKQPDLNMASLRPRYEEKSYQDLTIDAVTFSITAKDPELDVRQVDILLNPKTKKVKNIIIKKLEKTADSMEQKNMLWVHNMNFQVSSTITHNDGTTTDKVVKVVWDKPLQ
jgi:hypothetical protein